VISKIICAALVVGSTALTTRHASSSDQPLIWRDPGAIETRDLFWGSGSEARAPKPPFTFVEENQKGTVAKVVAKDASGDLWDVKLAGEEAHPEVVANRLLWALGYPVQEMYFVHEGVIQGLKDMKRSSPTLKSDGRFMAARFRRRDPAVKEAGGWAFDATPFSGRQELSGLIILMALINNWDTATDTNKEILQVTTPGGVVEQWYIVQDLGASFGRFKGPSGTPIKWTLAEFQKDNLIASVDGNTIVLNYPAFGTPPTRIPIEHARWFADLAGRLTDVQMRAAFKAGGATEAEVQGFTEKLQAKLAELRQALGSTAQP
jgi:hypothetical protein